MTTVDLLRETLVRDAESAASPARVAEVRARVLADQDAGRPTAPVVIAADVRRPTGGRRARALGLAAVAAVAVAGLVVTLFVANRPGAGTAPAASPPAPTTALPLDTYAFTVGADPGGLQFSYGGTTTGAQGGYWAAAGATSAPAALNVVTGTAGFPAPERRDDATTVTVDGTTGWSSPWRDGDPLTQYFGIDRPDLLTVWRDNTSGLWVSLTTVGLTTARVLELANSVAVASYHPVRSPLRATWLPAGSQLTAVSESAGHFQVVFGPHGSQFVIGVGPAGTEGGDGRTGTAPPQPLVVGRLRGSYIADDPITKVTDGRVDVIVMDGPGQAKAPGGPTAAMPLSQLRRLLAGLTVADLADPSTWTDLDVALP